MKPQILKKITFLAFWAAVAVAGRAQNLYWDPGLRGSTGGGGAGTWNFNGTANWYNGVSDVKWLDNSATGTYSAIFGNTGSRVTLASSLTASNLEFTAGGYALAGFGTLTLGAGGIDASSLDSGATTIGVPLSLAMGQQSWRVGSGSTLAVNGTVSRVMGAAVDFLSSGITSTSLANDSTGIIGPWATVGGTSGIGGDWAAVDGNGKVVAYTGYTSVTGGQSGVGAAGLNWQNDGGSVMLTANATVNSLKQLNDLTVNDGVTLNLGSGGLLMSGVSRWLLAGSTTTSFLTSGAATGELLVDVPNLTGPPVNNDGANNWTIWANIANNGPTPVILIKNGAGMLKLRNINSYTGGTVVNAGYLAVPGTDDYGQGITTTGNIAPFGSGPVVVNNSAVWLGSDVGKGGVTQSTAFSEMNLPNAFTFNGGTLYEVDCFWHLKGTLAVGPLGGTLGATFDGKTDALNDGFAKGLFVDGFLTGSGNLTIQHSGIEAANAWNSSTVYFTSHGTAAQNTYSGTLTVNAWGDQGGSYLYLIGTNALANATININGNNSADGRFGSPALLFGSGTNLDGIGYTTIGGLAGTGSFMLADTLVEDGSSSLGNGVILTVGNNNASTTYSGAMSGPGGLTKIGSGTLTLSGINTYTGNTILSGGSLVLSGAWLSSANVIVGAGHTLDISALRTVTLRPNQALLNGGSIIGNLDASSGCKVFAGKDGGYGTNRITGNMTMEAGATANLDVGTICNDSNDLIAVAGTLTANNNIIHLKAPNPSTNLDSRDYVLIQATGGVLGSFASTPTWDVAPANAAHYSIETGANTVTLHYSGVATAQ